MVRLLSSVLLIACGAASSLAFAADIADGHKVEIGVEFGYLKMSGHTSWTEGFVGKLRYDSDGAVFNRAYLDYSGRIADTLVAHVVLEGYDDDLGNAIDFTQAYVEWRPVPGTPTRYRLKLGAFYPRISLENNDPGWSNSYLLNSSAINTWVAEELRPVGAELTVSRRPVSLGGAHEFSINTAVFRGNDPAGSLLAWKGWSIHDRQTRFGDKLPLPPLPLIQPGRLFEAQDPYVMPFREVDNKVGYYINGEWKYGQRFLLRIMHYDNSAKPTKIVGGQYGWTTKFEHIGIRATLPGEILLVAQWMFGSTVMGPATDGIHAVDTEFDSQFILLTRRIDKHRLSVRYDRFEVTQNDSTPEDNNPENGHAWTAGYRYQFSDKVGLAGEWLSIKTHHCGWVYYGIDPTKTERQLQLTVKLSF